ncbi:MAG: DUF308 domain-containing protein [Bacteroidales bacterium]|nr:DUF308 domain-containing protein [Bacteroidales bacterium]
MFYFKPETKSSRVLKALIAIAVAVLLLVAKVNILAWVVQIIAAIFLLLGIVPLVMCLRDSSLQAYLPQALYRIVIAILVFMLAGPIGGIIKFILAILLILYGVSKLLSLFRKDGDRYHGYSQYEDDSVDEQ